MPFAIEVLATSTGSGRPQPVQKNQAAVLAQGEKDRKGRSDHERANDPRATFALGGGR